jgi:receptor protein-tyrosine kinase
MGAAFMEFLDLSVRRVADAEDVTGLSVVGMIPKMGAASRDPVSVAIGREAFRSLRTNLHFANGTPPRVIAVSSATPREGKTTVVVNLAASLAEQLHREQVLIIDADLRRPQIHRALGMEKGVGITDVLAGKATLERAIRVSPLNPALHVLSCGTHVANPSEVMSSQSFSNLVEALRNRFGFIVIDTPPLLAATDGAAIAKVVDGTLIVVRADGVDRLAVAHAMQQLRRIGAPLLGVILNGIGTRTGEGRYAYSYYEDYLAEDGDRGGRERPRHVLVGGTRGS